MVAETKEGCDTADEVRKMVEEGNILDAKDKAIELISSCEIELLELRNRYKKDKKTIKAKKMEAKELFDEIAEMISVEQAKRVEGVPFGRLVFGKDYVRSFCCANLKRDWLSREEFGVGLTGGGCSNDPVEIAYYDKDGCGYLGYECCPYCGAKIEFDVQ